MADIDQWQMDGSCGRRLYIGTRDAVGREGTGRAISNKKGGQKAAGWSRDPAGDEP